MSTLDNIRLRSLQGPSRDQLIIRDGYVPVPEFFFDKILPELTKGSRGLFTAALYLWLTCTANDTGEDRIAISKRELSESIGASLASTQRAIKALQEYGVLEVTKLLVIK